MRRILFEKTGNAVYISHLDLMRLFQRAFKRGGLNLKHTQGFSPRAMVSIALPLSVGVESVCEILDYELVGQDELSFEEIRDRLNRTMPSGVRVLEVYDSSRKPKELTHLDAAIRLEYDNGVPEGTAEVLQNCLTGFCDSCTVGNAALIGSDGHTQSCDLIRSCLCLFRCTDVNDGDIRTVFCILLTNLLTNTL